MPESSNWLPDLVLFSNYHGNWDLYLDAIYEFFKMDFINSQPCFPGKTFKLIPGLPTNGKEFTFWHIIQTGKNEEERIPDLRRCERIRWPRPIIEAIQSNTVLTWPNKRKNHSRLLISLIDFSYIVVLEDRRNYVRLLTAFPVDQTHTRKKYRKEYTDH